MDSIINDIDILKEKIKNEIESLRYYKELSYICDDLERQINNYDYDINNEFSLKQYKAFLEVFLDKKISYVNSLIINKQNNSIFDNGSQNDYQKINKLKNEITNLLTYIEDNFPIIGREVSQEYDEINSKFEKEFQDASIRYKKKFDREIEITNDIVLSIYGDTSSVLKSYINKLTAFKAVRVDSIKIFVDNDIKVKALFIRAYDTLKEPTVIEAVKQLEANYINEINKCVEKLSANTNILLIQENMIQNGLQLDRIIEMEKTKNNYYRLISNITLNYNNLDELLKIEDYVINNNTFGKEFYQVLYGLVEKEKYVYLKFNKEPSIYNRISEKSKIILEKMFIEKVNNLDDSLKEEIITNLKKYGYIKVLDINYQNFFDNSDFNIESNYSKELIEDDKDLECKYISTGIIEPHYDIIDKRTNKRVDRIFGIINNDVFTRIGDIYRYKNHKTKSFSAGIKDIIHYYDKFGNKIRPIKDDLIITKKVLDGYLAEKNENQVILDSNFNKVMDYRGKDIHKELLIDYKNNNIIIFDALAKEFSLYDRNFKLIKKIPLSIITNTNGAVSLYEKINMFNDGIVSIFINDLKDKYICYYDVLNMKKIDLFKIRYESSKYGYSEGLYTYFEYSKQAFGYKNLAGEVVIKPNYIHAEPFIGGCADVVRDLTANHTFINYQGEGVDNGAFLGYDTMIINMNLPKYRYEVVYPRNNKKYIIKVQNDYSILCDDKVIDIDFSEQKILTK